MGGAHHGEPHVVEPQMPPIRPTPPLIPALAPAVARMAMSGDDT
jgi:hypothetical protein